MLGQAPAQYGHAQTRWTLASIRHSCDWLRGRSLSGVAQVLQRLKVGLKRGRHYMHSPDPDYAAKVAYLQQCLQQARDNPRRYVVVYLDEVGYERQPTLAKAYAPRGSEVAPLARRSHRSNTVCRGVGALHPFTGQVTYRQFATITTQRLVQLYTELRRLYPDAETIFVIQDNWPVHYHPEVLAALQPQHYPFARPTIPAWSHLYTTPLVTGDLPIQLVLLPT